MNPIHLQAPGDGDRVDPTVEIVPDLGGEFRLVAGFFEYLGVKFSYPGKSPVPGSLANALLTGNRLELIEPLPEAVLGRNRCR